MPPDKLRSLIKAAGFDIRETKSSHIVCAHTDFPDVNFTVAIGNNSKKPTSQRTFADALLKLQDRKAEEAEKLVNSYRQATQDNLSRYYKDLPSYLSAEHDFQKGYTVIRDKQLPQLGITISFADARMLENKIRYMESLKRDTHILLNRCRMEYDIETEFDRGVLKGLSHGIYKLAPVDMEPYQAGGDPHRILDDINDFVCKVMDRDSEHDTRLDTLLAQDFVGAARVAYHARRGERTNAVRLHKPDGSSFTLKFETASNRRAEADNVHRGRITEAELMRVEKTIGTLAFAYEHREARSLKVA